MGLRSSHVRVTGRRTARRERGGLPWVLRCLLRRGDRSALLTSVAGDQARLFHHRGGREGGRGGAQTAGLSRQEGISSGGVLLILTIQGGAKSLRTATQPSEGSTKVPAASSKKAPPFYIEKWGSKSHCCRPALLPDEAISINAAGKEGSKLAILGLKPSFPPRRPTHMAGQETSFSQAAQTEGISKPPRTAFTDAK